MNISQEIQDAFLKENQMTLETAINHTEQWIAEGNFESAEAGIAEIKKFAPSLEELANLEAKIREKKASTVDTSISQQQEILEKSSNLESITKSEKFLAGIGYFGFLGVLPLALKPQSEFCQFHGKQSVTITLILTIVGIFTFFLPGQGTILGVLQVIIGIYGFIQANHGKLFSLPLIGDIAKKMPF